MKSLVVAAALAAMAAIAMAGSSTISTHDSTGATKIYDVITDGSGNFVGMQGVCDGAAAAQCAAVKAASTAAAQTDTALVVRNPDAGTIGDAAYTGSGNATAIAALKGIYAAATAPIAAGTNNIGKIDILGNAGGAMDAAGQNAAAPANELIVGCQFNTSPTTITSGNVSPVQCNSSGAVKVDGSAVTQTVSGTVTANQGGAPWQQNVTQFNGTAATAKASGANAATTDTALVVAPSPNPSTVCTSVKPISQTASTDLITSTNKLHICSVVLVSATAQNLSLVEGTGTTCATGIAALIGGTTASLAAAANGGFSAVSERPWLVTQTTGDHLCLLQSGTGNVSGVITYTDHN